MRARAFRGGDLFTFQCHVISVPSAGIRQPSTVLSCLPCLREQEQAGASLQGERGCPVTHCMARVCQCELQSWDFTLPFSPDMMDLKGKNFGPPVAIFLSCPIITQVFPSGLCCLTFRKNIVLFLHRKSWGFPAGCNERPLIPLLMKNKGSFFFFIAEEQADCGSTALWAAGRVVWRFL